MENPDGTFDIGWFDQAGCKQQLCSKSASVFLGGQVLLLKDVDTGWFRALEALDRKP